MTKNKNNRRSIRRGGLSPDKYLTTEQVQTVKKYLADQVKKAPTDFQRGRAAMNQMLFDFGINTGLRAEEICKLQMRDMPMAHGKKVVNVRNSKMGISRAVNVSSVLIARLRKHVKAWRKSAKPKSHLFVNENGGGMSYRSLYSKITGIGKNASVPLTPHMLRHTYATAHYAKYKDLFSLMDQLGHAKPETTAIYAKTADEERQRQAENLDL